ncbi:MAG: VCBS repeat-containing protein [Planctomycetaceae bacterium]
MIRKLRLIRLLSGLSMVVTLLNVAEGDDRSPSLRFSERLIADNYAYAYGIAAADIDADGDLDLTSADYTPHNRLYLFENDGQGSFQRHIIQQDDPERLERHLVGDVDGDGDLDVVIVKNLRGHLLWFENDGSPMDDVLWQRHVVTTELPGAYDVALADFDQDGDLDVAASSWVLGNQFAWFENDGSPGDGEWQKHMIEADVPETRTIRAADFDGDGDADLLGTIRQSGEVVWYENSLADGSISWSRHMIDDESVCPAHGNPVDMDCDGDLDVVMALGFYFKPDDDDPKASHSSDENQIVWYENNSPTQDGWARHVITSGFDDAFEAIAADLDGDGDVDVAGTSWRNPGRVAWFENHGDPKGNWTRHVLNADWRSANQVIIADLDGDGRPDIAACAERGSNEFRWWRNEGRANGAE